MNKEISRRDFLRTSGKGLLGVAAVSMIPAAMAETAAPEIGAPAYPWTYHKLDKKAVQDRAFTNFGLYGGCCSSVASAIIEALAENQGSSLREVMEFKQRKQSKNGAFRDRIFLISVAR